MKRKILSLITAISMLLTVPSYAATGHINGCTNTDFSTNCCTKTFNIAPKPGYKIKDVLVNGESQGAITSYTFSNMTEAQNLKVVTEPDTWTITVTQASNGTISPGTASVKTGESKIFTIVPNTGYVVKKIIVDGKEDLTGICTVDGDKVIFNNVSANHTITATYIQDIKPTIPIGAYITYKPTKTSYTVSSSGTGVEADTTFKPSTTTKWRVLYNNNGQLDIISANNVGSIKFVKNANSYLKGVETLNNLCAQYVNTKYATSGRCLGSSEDSQGVVAHTFSTSNMIYAAKANTFPYTDTTYCNDVAVLKAHFSLPTSAWLASRYCEYNNSYNIYNELYIRFLTTSNAVGKVAVYDFYSSGSSSGLWPGANYVYPVVSLKPGISIASGSGTDTDPYVLSDTVNENVQYTPHQRTLETSGAVNAALTKDGVIVYITVVGVDLNISLDGTAEPVKFTFNADSDGFGTEGFNAYQVTKSQTGGGVYIGGGTMFACMVDGLKWTKHVKVTSTKSSSGSGVAKYTVYSILVEGS